MVRLLQIREVSLVYGRRRPTLAIEQLDLDIDEGRSWPSWGRQAAASHR